MFKQLRQSVSSASRPGDWNQWGGSPSRNNTPEGKNIPTEWDVGEFDRKTGEWKKDKGQEHQVGRPGSARRPTATRSSPTARSTSAPTTAPAGSKRYPADSRPGLLLCFDEADGKFLWQHSSEKLPTGRVHDWPLQGICCAPLVEGDRLWFVTSRGEVICLDTEGFHDDENDGPLQRREVAPNKDEADVIWLLDMMKELGVSQHNMCSCSVTAAGDMLFVITSNGVDEAHINLPAPQRPSFIVPGQEHRQGALDRQLARRQHSARPVVVARLCRARRRAAGDLRRRRRLALQLLRRRRARTASPSCCGSSTAIPRNRSTSWAAAPTATTSSARR